MKCPECTYELYLVKYNVYRCLRCRWMGAILDYEDASQALSILAKHADLPAAELELEEYSITKTPGGIGGLKRRIQGSKIFT